MSVTLRRLHASDDLDQAARLFDQYRQFYKQAADEKLARDFLTARLAGDESVVFLAEIDGRAVGFMQLFPSFCSIAAAPIWVLNDLFVLPEVRGQRVAARLLDMAKELGRSNGSAYLMLSTAHTNHTAQGVYEANGWDLDEVYRVYTFTL